MNYPKLNIRSKNELAKQISDSKFTQADALRLINDVLDNFDQYWHDNLKMSEPAKEKYVRSAAGTPLGSLLKKINNKLLKKYDKYVPAFIFGGISTRNHIQAAAMLLGKQKSRTLIKLDLSRFFEQIERKRVFYFFNKKCGCSVRVSNLLADLCCIPTGPKESPSTTPVLARGFATSPRLAVWTNINTFVRLKWKANRILKGYDPRIAIFVDDIGISASKITDQSAKKVLTKVDDILKKFDKNQQLVTNKDKTRVVPFYLGAEHLGLKLGRNIITAGKKTLGKFSRIKRGLSRTTINRKSTINIIKSYYCYFREIRRSRAQHG